MRPQKVVRRQSAGKPRRRPGRQNVRRPSHIIAQRHRAEWPQETRPPRCESCQAFLPDPHKQCANARWQTRSPARPPHSNRSPESMRQTLRAIAAPDRRAQHWPTASPIPPLPLRAVLSLQVIKTLEPGACSAWAIRSAAAKSARVVSSAITTTSLGPAIESISTSPNTNLFASATNWLPGPTILSTFTSGQPPTSARPYANAATACAPPTRYTSLDAQFVTRRQHAFVVRAIRRRRRHDDNVLHTSRLRRHCRHQHRRRISRRATRHANPHALQRQIALPQLATHCCARVSRPCTRSDRRSPNRRRINLHIPMQNRRLKPQNVVANPANRVQKIWRHLRVSRRQFSRRHSQRFRRKLAPSNLAVYRKTADRPSDRTSQQICSTTSAGDSGLPKTSTVFRRPASLTILPLGASFRAAQQSPLLRRLVVHQYVEY